jgi:hypothetical protein
VCSDPSIALESLLGPSIALETVLGTLKPVLGPSAALETVIGSSIALETALGPSMALEVVLGPFHYTRNRALTLRGTRTVLGPSISAFGALNQCFPGGAVPSRGTRQGETSQGLPPLCFGIQNCEPLPPVPPPIFR